jgi:hypothetical protein
METSHPPHSANDHTKHLYHQLEYTLTGRLPPPLDDTPVALRARNDTAIAKVAARPAAAAVEALAACVDQRIEENVSENGMNSHDAAFETGLSEQPWHRGSR